MRITFIVFLIIFTYSSCSQKGFVGISKNIEKRCTAVKGRWKGTTFHELRTRLYNEGKLNFLESDFDTLYILENYEVETGTYISRIWNKRGGVSYVYNRNSFSSDREKLFTDYTVQLVQAWDTATIKREASINASTLPERYINATRLSLANAQTKIECITFKEFFELERDR